MNITIREDIDSLNYQEWSFWVDGYNFWLDEFTVFTKENSRKKKYEKSKSYNRILNRSNTLTVDEVVIPEHIAKQVVEKFTNRIEVKKWQ